MPQPFFRNKKSQNPYLQIHVFLPRLSSSSDLRIVSFHTAFSGFPNDRLSSSVVPPRIQRRYRPGFAPGFLFSYGAVPTSAGTQTEYLLLNIIHNNSKKVNRKRSFYEIYIPPPGLYGVGGFAIIVVKVPRLAATKPGRADQNRQIKAGTVIIAQPAGKRKRYLYEKDYCILPVGCSLS